MKLFRIWASLAHTVEVAKLATNLKRDILLIDPFLQRSLLSRQRSRAVSFSGKSSFCRGSAKNAYPLHGRWNRCFKYRGSSRGLAPRSNETALRHRMVAAKLFTFSTSTGGIGWEFEEEKSLTSDLNCLNCDCLLRGQEPDWNLSLFSQWLS